jgi:hypothetical protein
MDEPFMIAVLPYLKTSAPVQYRNITFRNSTDLSGLASTVADHVRSISEMFFLSYGRHIFQICVTTILTGSIQARQLRLSSMLVTNQQRFEAICRDYDATDRPISEKIAAIAERTREIEQYRFVPEEGLNIETMLGAVRRAIQQYLSSPPAESEEVRRLLQEFLAVKDDPDHYKALSSLRRLNEQMKPEPPTAPTELTSLRAITQSLLDSAWGYTFQLYFGLRRQKDPNQGGKPAE